MLAGTGPESPLPSVPLAPRLHPRGSMRFALLLLAALCAAPTAARAQGSWTIGAGSGAFVFGDFVEIHTTVSNELDRLEIEETLSAATRAGLHVQIGRWIDERWSIRADGTFVRAPFTVETASNDDSGVSLEVGEIDVVTVALAAALRFNRGGALRPSVFAGPAWTSYSIDRNEQTGAPPVFTGSRSELGGVAGAGLEWWLSDRFAVQGEISDTLTPSPFEREDFPAVNEGELNITDIHHVHTIIGVLYRF